MLIMLLQTYFNEKGSKAVHYHPFYGQSFLYYITKFEMEMEYTGIARVEKTCWQCTESGTVTER